MNPMDAKTPFQYGANFIMRCRFTHVSTYVALLCLLINQSAWAANGGIVRVGLESGGETVVEIEDARGTSIPAGGLYYFEMGFKRSLMLERPLWETEATLGYKADARSHRGGDVTFSRITVNLVQFYRATPRLRFGAGATFHVNAKAEADLPEVLDFDKKLDNSAGFIIAADFQFFSRVNLGVRATFIDYGVDGRTASASSAGFYSSFVF